MKSMKNEFIGKEPEYIYVNAENNKKRRVGKMKGIVKRMKVVAALAAFLGATAAGMSTLMTNPVMAEEVSEMRVADAKSGYSIPSEITVKKGEKKVVNLTAPGTEIYTVDWSYNPNYVEFSSTGGYGSYWGQPGRCTITGKTEGTYTMYMTVKVYSKKGDPDSYKKTIKLTSKVNVVDGTSKNTSAQVKRPLQKISLNKTSATLNKDSSLNLSVGYTPSNTTDSKNVTWKSSDTSVATVSGGKVVAKKAGTATITARVGTKTASCKITVVVPLKSISLNKSSISLKAGDDQMLYYTTAPTGNTDKGAITWSSSNTAVATVSGGRVIAKKAGSAVITVKKSGKTATCKVTVTAKQQAATVKPTTVTSKEGYKNVSDAYGLTNSFRTSRSNQWYWNADNKTKTYTYGLKGLTRDVALENTAKLRAKEQWTQLYVNGKKTHDRPNGFNCFTAYPKGYTYMGENLGWGQTSSSAIILDGTWGWAETNKKYADQGHRRNMLNSMFTKVGIACYEKNGKTCWAMCLGR